MATKKVWHVWQSVADCFLVLNHPPMALDVTGRGGHQRGRVTRAARPLQASKTDLFFGGTSAKRRRGLMDWQYKFRTHQIFERHCMRASTTLARSFPGQAKHSARIIQSQATVDHSRGHQHIWFVEAGCMALSWYDEGRPESGENRQP